MVPASMGRADSRRAHEMRIVVECDARPGCDGDGLAEVLTGRLTDWQVTALFADEDQVWVIAGRSADLVGTADYARAAHTLVQDILDLATVNRAEADLPVNPRGGSDRNAQAGPATPGPCPPGSEARRWARDAIRCAEAWAVPARPGGRARGAGVLLGQPDTGYTPHPDLGAGALDLTRDWDVIDNDDDALDPLVSADASPWPLAYPGHGTGTASIIVGRGTERDGIRGVAPEAVLLPIRAVESVVQLFDTDVARSVEYARATGCHIISLSLGGKGFFGLQRAIQRAVDAGVIVLAAAGNQVGIVVAPASYPNCLAVAATGVDDQLWPLSSRGRAVDVSAPGWCVWVADAREGDNGPAFEVRLESGTSYAVAHVAGVAALWLAHHGPEAVRNRYGPGVQAVFLHLLQGKGVRVPPGWDPSARGAGIVDAAAMLLAPLPPVVESTGAGDATASAGTTTPFGRLAALVDHGEKQFGELVAMRLGISGEELRRVVARFEGELAFHLLAHPGFRAALLSGSSESGRRGLADTHATCSPGFAARFLPRGS